MRWRSCIVQSEERPRRDRRDLACFGCAPRAGISYASRPAISAPARRQRHAAAIRRGLAQSPAGDAPGFLALVVALVVADVAARCRVHAAGSAATNPGLVARLEARLAAADAVVRGGGELGKLRDVRRRLGRCRRRGDCGGPAAADGHVMRRPVRSRHLCCRANGCLSFNQPPELPKSLCSAFPLRRSIAMLRPLAPGCDDRLSRMMPFPKRTSSDVSDFQASNLECSRLRSKNSQTSSARFTIA